MFIDIRGQSPVSFAYTLTSEFLMAQTADVIIIGGGVHGASMAFYI
jgi:hypothetical protein